MHVTLQKMMHSEIFPYTGGPEGPEGALGGCAAGRLRGQFSKNAGFHNSASPKPHPCNIEEDLSEDHDHMCSKSF